MSEASSFISLNGTWILSVLGVMTAFCGATMAYCLKSRCVSIKLCWNCIDCERNPNDIPASSQIPVTDAPASPAFTRTI